MYNYLYTYKYNKIILRVRISCYTNIILEMSTQCLLIFHDLYL